MPTRVPMPQVARVRVHTSLCAPGQQMPRHQAAHARAPGYAHPCTRSAACLLCAPCCAHPCALAAMHVLVHMRRPVAQHASRT